MATIKKDSFHSNRLQTLDHGAPVSVFTVAKEVGHNSTATTERVYSHLGEVHHRGEGLEYRLEDHADTLKDRLAGHGLVLQDER